MGDSRSWSVFVLHLAVPVGGDGEAAQFLLVRIDQADGCVVEADQPFTVLGLLDRDGLARERGRAGRVAGLRTATGFRITVRRLL